MAREARLLDHVHKLVGLFLLLEDGGRNIVLLELVSQAVPSQWARIGGGETNVLDLGTRRVAA